MPLLQLWFDTSDKTELTRTVFEHPAVGSRIVAVRGKCDAPFKSTGSFQWSPAVRAMSVLFLHAKALSLNQITSSAILKSTSRGPVTALDYAIGRSAQWIQDVFGVTRRGECVARRLFHRENPERKRPGPTSISLNTLFLHLEEVEIYLNERWLQTGPEIETILRLLDGDDERFFLHEVSKSGEISENVFPHIDWVENVTSSFIEEAKIMLQATAIFSKNFVKRGCSFISTSPSLTSVKSKLIESLYHTHITPAASMRLGLQYPSSIIHRELFRDTPLRFGVTPSQIGTLALLRYLQKQKQLPIQIDYSFNHTRDLVEAIESGISDIAPDCCVITTASYALLSTQNQKEYVPLMIMPSASHTILSAKTSPRNLQKKICRTVKFHLLDSFPTTPSLWLDSLIRDGAFSANGAERVHTEPDEALNELLQSQDASLRAILWFPFNLIGHDLLGAAPSPNPEKKYGNETFIQNILVVRRSLLHANYTSKILTSLFNDAWLTLLEHPGLCSQYVREQVAETNYRRMIWRYSGMSRLTQYSQHSSC